MTIIGNKSAESLLTGSQKVLRDHLRAMVARKEEIEASSKPLRDQRQALHNEQNSIIERVQALDQQIDRLERPELIPLMEEISRVARILGGKSMSDNAREEPATSA